MNSTPLSRKLTRLLLPEPEFDKSKWYCVVCPCDPRAMSFPSVNRVKQHVLQHHCILQPKEKKHFLVGWQAVKLWKTRIQYADNCDDRHLRAFTDPNYSAHDLMMDCLGYDAPPEPPCHKQPKIQTDRKKGKRVVGS